MKKMTDLDYMRLSIEEMRKSIQESRNDEKISPKVGAVLVRNDGSYVAAHRGELREGDHAEYTLLERKCTAENVTGTVVFTTLEPCCERHMPKVSCSQRLIEARVRKVYIGIEDPDPTVSGKGKQRLMEAGIEVAMYPPELQKEIEEANKDFLQGAYKRRLMKKEETDEPVTGLAAVASNVTIADLRSTDLNRFLRIIKVKDLQSEEGISALKQLQIIGEKEGSLAPTGFGLLLFGKNPQFTFQNAAIRAIYKSGTQERDMQTFGGALIEQSKKLYEWYQDKIPSHFDRNSPVRQKIYDYSIEVISELVKNAIIHRDYTISGAPIYFEINDENIIIKSPGYPVEPIKLSQIQAFNAPSLSRNPLVMFVFEKLNLAEQRGLGFGTIRQLPRSQRPIVTFEDPYIVFTLPLTKNTRNNTIAPNDISMFLEEHPTFTRAQFATYFALSDKSAVRLINKMISEGIISASGEKRGIKYAKI